MLPLLHPQSKELVYFDKTYQRYIKSFDYERSIKNAVIPQITGRFQKTEVTELHMLLSMSLQQDFYLSEHWITKDDSIMECQSRSNITAKDLLLSIWSSESVSIRTDIICKMFRDSDIISLLVDSLEFEVKHGTVLNSTTLTETVLNFISMWLFFDINARTELIVFLSRIMSFSMGFMRKSEIIATNLMHILGGYVGEYTHDFLKMVTNEGANNMVNTIIEVANFWNNSRTVMDDFLRVVNCSSSQEGWLPHVRAFDLLIRAQYEHLERRQKEKRFNYRYPQLRTIATGISNEALRWTRWWCPFGIERQPSFLRWCPFGPSQQSETLSSVYQTLWQLEDIQNQLVAFENAAFADTGVEDRGIYKRDNKRPKRLSNKKIVAQNIRANRELIASFVIPFLFVPVPNSFVGHEDLSDYKDENGKLVFAIM